MCTTHTPRSIPRVEDLEGRVTPADLSVAITGGPAVGGYTLGIQGSDLPDSVSLRVVNEQYILHAQNALTVLDQNIDLANLRTVQFNGAGGNDLFLVEGGQFTFEVSGGDGDDVLSFQLPGTDHLAGGIHVFGDAGNDTIAVVGGILATINGGTGNDVLIAGNYRQVLHGDDGNDTILAAGPFSDRRGAEAHGGAGNDVIRTTSGLAEGGAGDDVFVVYSPASWLDAAPTEIYGYEGADTFVSYSIYGVHFYGGSGNDLIYGGPGRNWLDGGPDRDRIVGGTGPNTITGGDGDDTLYAGDGSENTLSGGAGQDILVAGRYGASLDGGVGSDYLYGGPGNDVLIGGAGMDYLDGKGGNDTLSGGDDPDYILGGAGADAITGGAGDDYIDGGDGNDVIYGEAGQDYILGGRGNDTIDGGLNSDYLFGNAGNDLIHGGNGNDAIYGGSGNDRLYGDDLTDWIYGQEGNDYLVGGSGDDYLHGGTGRNVLIQDFPVTSSAIRPRVTTSRMPFRPKIVQRPRVPMVFYLRKTPVLPATLDWTFRP